MNNDEKAEDLDELSPRNKLDQKIADIKLQILAVEKYLDFLITQTCTDRRYLMAQNKCDDLYARFDPLLAEKGKKIKKEVEKNDQTENYSI